MTDYTRAIHEFEGTNVAAPCSKCGREYRDRLHDLPANQRRFDLVNVPTAGGTQRIRTNRANLSTAEIRQFLKGNSGD